MPDAPASRLTAALIFALGCAPGSHADTATPSGAAPSQVYRVALSEDWERLSVEACFYGDLPVRLHAGSDEAYQYLVSPGIRHGARTFTPSPGALSLPLETDNESACLEYSVAIRAAADVSRRDSSTGNSDTLIVSPGLWFWRPAQLPGDALLRFELPQGVNVSAPWQVLERRGNITRFHLSNTPPSWPARMAIGRFPVHELAVGDARLQLAILDAAPPADEAAVAAWLDEAARAVTTLYGRFPLPQAQLLLTPIGRQAEPVPWGQVLRGGEPSAHLFFDRGARTLTHAAALHQPTRCVAVRRLCQLLPERVAGACWPDLRDGRMAQAGGRVRTRPERDPARRLAGRRDPRDAPRASVHARLLERRRNRADR